METVLVGLRRSLGRFLGERVHARPRALRSLLLPLFRLRRGLRRQICRRARPRRCAGGGRLLRFIGRLGAVVHGRLLLDRRGGRFVGCRAIVGRGIRVSLRARRLDRTIRVLHRVLRAEDEQHHGGGACQRQRRDESTPPARPPRRPWGFDRRRCRGRLLEDPVEEAIGHVLHRERFSRDGEHLAVRLQPFGQDLVEAQGRWIRHVLEGLQGVLERVELVGLELSHWLAPWGSPRPGRRRCPADRGPPARGGVSPGRIACGSSPYSRARPRPPRSP